MKIITDARWGSYEVSVALGRISLTSPTNYTTKGNAKRAANAILNNLSGDGYLSPDYDNMCVCLKNRNGLTLAETQPYSTKGNLMRAFESVQNKIDTRNVEFVDR